MPLVLEQQQVRPGLGSFTSKARSLLLFHRVRDHALRSAGRLWSIQLARELLHRLPVQHAVRRSHLCLPDQDGHLGGAAGAHPCLWSVCFHFYFAEQSFLCVRGFDGVVTFIALGVAVS